MTEIERTSDLILLSHYNRDLVERHPDSHISSKVIVSSCSEPVYGMRAESRAVNINDLFEVAERIDEIFGENRPQLP